jgi:hypothetical protein
MASSSDEETTFTRLCALDAVLTLLHVRKIISTPRLLARITTSALSDAGMLDAAVSEADVHTLLTLSPALSILGGVITQTPRGGSKRAVASRKRAYRKASQTRVGGSAAAAQDEARSEAGDFDDDASSAAGSIAPGFPTEMADAWLAKAREEMGFSTEGGSSRGGDAASLVSPPPTRDHSLLALSTRGLAIRAGNPWPVVQRGIDAGAGADAVERLAEPGLTK